MESRTGFEKNGGTLQRNCHICRFMLRDVCTQTDMIDFSKQPRDSHGLPRVERNDVCDYFRKANVGTLLRGE